MKRLPQKSALLFGAVLMVCAFVVPSMALAATWQTNGSVTHQLFSSNFSVTSTLPAHFGWSCAATEFDVDVANVTTLELTSASFQNCSGTLMATGCTVTATGTSFPWTVTAPTTTSIEIHGVRIDVRYETKPPAGGTGCALNGVTTILTGTLTGGVWDPSGTGADRRLTFNGAAGLTDHLLHPGMPFSGPARVTGTFRDTTETLNLIDV